MGISFAPARGLSADELIDAINKNKAISPNLKYNMAAALGRDPLLESTKEDAISALRAFDQELSSLPQDAGANMQLEFTVSNPHEKEIIDDAQKAISKLVEASTKDIAKVSAVKA